MQIPETGPPVLRLRLIEARVQKGWLQQEVADRLGTTHVNVSRWERGITRPNPYFRRRLCLLYGKKESELDLAPLPASAPPVSPASSASSSPHEALYDPVIPLSPGLPLVGRNNELAAIRRRLFSDGNVALTALNGLPGVGKTALSIALAHDPETLEHFRDGVLWAALGPSPNVQGVLSRWGTLLGIPAAEMAALNSDKAWAEALHLAIGRRSMLLVIDDAWHIHDALTFKIGGPNCAHLVTTRYPSIATTVASRGAFIVKELGEEESIDLLNSLAPGVVDQEVKKAHDLVHAVGGLPLALTLIGNYLRARGYAGQPRRIRATLEQLSDAEERLQLSEAQGSVEGHTSLSTEAPLSLESVIAVSDQHLPEQAHAALYALAVFPPKPNSFSEAAALAVTNCPVDILDILVDTGLVESSGPDRYTLHQVIADYARLRLQDDTAYDRLIDYAGSYIEAHKKDYELLDRESSVLLAALETAYQRSQSKQLARGAIGFTPFLLSRGLYSLAEQLLLRASEAAAALQDNYSITSTLLYLGEIAQKQGNYPQAEASYKQGLALARQLQDNERISALLTNLGWVTLKRGEYAQAQTYLLEGLPLARQLQDDERISGLLEMLGSLEASQGRYARSETYLQEGLVIAREVGANERICTILINLGATAGEQGNNAQEKMYYQEGLMLARQIGHREWTSLLLINLGAMAVEQMNYTLAETYYEEGLALARQIEHRESISILLLGLGVTTVAQGSHAQAEAYLQEALTLARQIGRPRIISLALYEYGNLHLNQKRLEAAEATFREMLTTLPEGDQELLALEQYGLARAVAAQGNIHQARMLGEASATTFEVMGYHKATEVRNWLGSIMV